MSDPEPLSLFVAARSIFVTLFNTSAGDASCASSTFALMMSLMPIATFTCTSNVRLSSLSRRRLPCCAQSGAQVSVISTSFSFTPVIMAASAFIKLSCAASKSALLMFSSLKEVVKDRTMRLVGETVGLSVASDGDFDGLVLGDSDGDAEGLHDGDAEGDAEGLTVGLDVGRWLKQSSPAHGNGHSHRCGGARPWPKTHVPPFLHGGLHCGRQNSSTVCNPPQLHIFLDPVHVPPL